MGLRGIAKPVMTPLTVVVLDVLGNRPPEMAFVLSVRQMRLVVGTAF